MSFAIICYVVSSSYFVVLVDDAEMSLNLEKVSGLYVSARVCVFICMYVRTT